MLHDPNGMLISIFLLAWLLDTQIAMKKTESSWYTRDFASGTMTQGEAPFYFAVGLLFMLAGSLLMALRPWNARADVPPLLPGAT